MKARIANRTVTTNQHDVTFWKGKAEFSDGETFDFFRIESSPFPKLLVEVEGHMRWHWKSGEYCYVDPFVRYIRAKGQRRQALLDAFSSLKDSSP